MRLDRITLYIPETLNDKSPVSPARFASYEAEMLDMAVGFTLGELRKVEKIGGWRSPLGKLYRELIRVYEIDVVDVDAVRESLLTLAHRIRVELGQESIYLAVSAIEVTEVTELVAA